jgi:hypothetical protein
MQQIPRETSEMNKNNSKGFMNFLKEYNIDKVDILIYSISIITVLILILTFVFANNSLGKKIKNERIMQKKLANYRSLKGDAVNINQKYNKIKPELSVYLNNYLNTNPGDIANFIEYVKQLANKYLAKDMSANPTASVVSQIKSVAYSAEVGDYFIDKGVFRADGLIDIEDNKKKANIQFSRQAISITMEMSLGNLICFLYSLENSSKFVEVSNLVLSGTGGASEYVRAELVVAVYTINDILIRQAKAMYPDINSDTIRGIKLLIEPPVSRARKDRAEQHRGGLSEYVKYFGPERIESNEFKVIQVFKALQKPPERNLFPNNLNVSAILNTLVAFDLGGKTYFADMKSEDKVLKDRTKKPIPGFETLKLNSIDAAASKVILENSYESETQVKEYPFRK